MLLLLLDFPWYSLARELVAPLLSFWGFLRYVSTHHWWLSSFSWTGKPDRFRIKCNFRFPQTMPGFLLCGTEVAAMTQRRLAPYGLHDLDSRIVLASSGRSVWTSAKIRKKKKTCFDLVMFLDGVCVRDFDSRSQRPQVASTSSIMMQLSSTCGHNESMGIWTSVCSVLGEI